MPFKNNDSLDKSAFNAKMSENENFKNIHENEHLVLLHLNDCEIA